MSQRKRGPLQLQELVIGKSKAYKDRIGRLIEMVVVNGSLKYRIRWDNDTETVIGKTGVKRHEMPEINRQLQVMNDEADVDNISISSENSVDNSSESSEDENRVTVENDLAEEERYD